MIILRKNVQNVIFSFKIKIIIVKFAVALFTRAWIEISIKIIVLSAH